MTFFFSPIVDPLTVSQVLETCVKNCGHRFHVLVASQDFVDGVLVHAILPKNNPPTALHERVLSLIQVTRQLELATTSKLTGIDEVRYDSETSGGLILISLTRPLGGHQGAAAASTAT